MLKVKENKNILASTFGDQKRWINWKQEIREGKPTKIPCSTNGRNADISNVENLSNYADATKASSKVGIVFLPDQMFLGIDIDHCLENGEVVHEHKDKIIQLIAFADTYTEISPSGVGLHLYLSLTAPLDLITNKHSNFEAYTSGRYFTVTNDPYREEKPVRTIAPDEAIALLSIIGYPWGKLETQQATALVASVSLDDTTVLFTSKTGDKIKSLYNGDIADYDNDDSRADLALCSYLAFWTGRNAEQMDRIWRNSPLGDREKTQTREKGYRDITIKKAIDGCDKVYYLTREKEVPAIKTNEEKEIIENNKIKLTSWGDFSSKEFPEVKWRINNLIPVEGFVILSAISGEKKTWVSLEMARCISEGVNFLDIETYKTEKAKVLYVDQENPERDIVRRGKQLGIKGSENLFLFRPNSLNLNDESVANDFIKMILDNDIKVVFIDTLRSVAGGLKEEKAEDIRMFFNRFKIFKDKGIVIVWLDHRRKPQNFEGKVPKKEQLLGSQDKTASVEVLLLLSSDSGSNEIRVYQAKNRLDVEIEPFKILMEDSIAGDGTKITSLLYDGKIEADETKKYEAKEAIITTLQVSGKTTKEVCDVVGTQKRVGTKNIKSALNELVKDGIIDYTKQGHSNFYFIKEETQGNIENALNEF